jgi:ATP-dependent DNA helicase PIF1
LFQAWVIMFKDNKIASKALKLMLGGEQNLYITGDAGTGKSTLLRHFLEQTDKKVAVLAPTGMAAVNVGGETIHSFCRFGVGAGWRMLEEGKINKLRDSRRVKAIEVLVVDEVSMVRADMLDALDVFFRLNKGRTNVPFGGVQVILFGDHFQLPPILRSDEKPDFFQRYDTEQFFGANVLPQLELNYIKLTHNYRQSEENFIKFLNYLRYGIGNDELIRWVNSTFLGKPVTGAKLPITITTVNNDATNLNYRELDRLVGQDFAFRATITGKFGEEMYPTEKYLVLKEGAQVMFVKNDPEKKWVNGTIGVVTKLDDENIEVKVGKKTLTVDKASWEVHSYEYDEKQGELVQKVVGEFCQYPLKLAWAVTIHKSQGQTFDNCIINMGRGAFSFGQTYVAFSRCRTIGGIHLNQALKLSDISADPAVFAFDKGINWNEG